MVRSHDVILAESKSDEENGWKIGRKIASCDRLFTWAFLPLSPSYHTPPYQTTTSSVACEVPLLHVTLVQPSLNPS